MLVMLIHQFFFLSAMTCSFSVIFLPYFVKYKIRKMAKVEIECLFKMMICNTSQINSTGNFCLEFGVDLEIDHVEGKDDAEATPQETLLV